MLPPHSGRIGLASALALSLLAVAVPSQAVAPFPDAPNIASVTSVGSGSLQIAYVLPLSSSVPPVTEVQVTSNGGNTWSACGMTLGLCVVSGLTDGVKYIVALRAVNEAGPGPMSALGSGVPTLPIALDKDKLTKLPKSRIMVTGKFNGAANDLGVNAASTRVGIGTLPKLTFNREIPNKAVVERHLTVSAKSDSTGPTQVVPGAWSWQSNRSVMFRPTTFWPGHSTITISSSLNSTNMGVSGGATLVGTSSLGTTYSFKTARSFIGRVNGATHSMSIYIDGVKVKTFKTSLGGPNWRTRNGVKVVSTQKEPFKTYTSGALGITDPSEQYSLDARWNTRITPSGEFIHAAPWATGRLGLWNGSHGCTNMYESDAEWIYKNTIPGDVFVYTNTLGNLAEPNNGPGGLWNVAWSTWLKKSALNTTTVTPTMPPPVPVPTPVPSPTLTPAPTPTPTTVST
ncbi:MAG: Ig-like domain-containing protein [Actinomycetota bacterium]|nr:Ig-like domain-containing protein [Actinomycetota bacterium]